MEVCVCVIGYGSVCNSCVRECPKSEVTTCTRADCARPGELENLKQKTARERKLNARSGGVRGTLGNVREARRGERREVGLVTVVCVCVVCVRA